jgi:hypothetical protein
MKSIVIPAVLSVALHAAVVFALTGTNSPCLQCIYGNRPHHPSECTPINIQRCIRDSIANCTSCDSATIVYLCNIPQVNHDPRWWPSWLL